VTDIQNWEIHTNWPNTEKRIYKFTNAEIATKKSVENMLREMFITPERLHPNRNTEQVTTAAADVFRLIADDMRKEDALTPKSPLPQGARGLEDVSDSPSLYTERGLGGEVNVRGGEVKDRTLTNLYNALNVWRGKDKMKTKDAAADFAPRLDELHNALDQAVCDAYGWPHEILNDEEAILRNLLALNLERAALNGGGEA
ncbi:MAG: hypothetical protein ABI690_26890, partial [Chloroflexota bacterium]